MTNRVVGRRQLLLSTFLTGLLPFPRASAFDARTARRAAIAAEPPEILATGRRTFFTPAERSFIISAIDRLIPGDEWPGAVELGVADYIENQLAGSFGEGISWYMQGPWHDGTETQGFQSRYAPAALFRAGIRATDDHCMAQFGRGFSALDAAQQDDILHGLESGKIALDGIHARTFFNELRQATIEGFFGDPVYGGNRDMKAWRMIGFPGARYDYRAYVDRHNVRLDFEPV